MAKGWSQPELGERVGASTTTVSNWETEKTKPGIEDINVLATALQVSPEELLISMGVMLTPTPEARLPRDVVEWMRSLTPDRMQALRLLLPGLAGLPASRQEKDRR